MKYFVQYSLIIVFGLACAGLTSNSMFRNNAAHIAIPLKHTVPRIAHAGGGYKGLTYTNSIDALNFNADKFDLFEIDFEFTSDGELVCMHDWHITAKAAFGREFDPPPTLREFEHYVAANDQYKTCTLASLIEWLKDHPRKKIVSDVKGDNIKALAYIARVYPDYIPRFIPQIYAPEQYSDVKNLSYKNIIFTLYKYHQGTEHVMAFAQKLDLYAVTMPINRAPYLAKLLSDRGIPTYVHTINSEAEFQHFKSMGISEIYTDWLPADQ